MVGVSPIIPPGAAPSEDVRLLRKTGSPTKTTNSHLSWPLSPALQGIDPLRVYTPTDKLADDKIRDGIVLGSRGEPGSTGWKTSAPGGGCTGFKV